MDRPHLEILLVPSLGLSRHVWGPSSVLWVKTVMVMSRSKHTSCTGVPCSISGPPSPVIFPVVAASSLTCGSCSWLVPGGSSACGRGFSSAVIDLLCWRRIHSGNGHMGEFKALGREVIDRPVRLSWRWGRILASNGCSTLQEVLMHASKSTSTDRRKFH